MSLFQRLKPQAATVRSGDRKMSVCVTCAEGVDVLVKLEAHDRAVVVDDVGLAIPGARHHLLPAIPLQADAHVHIQRVGLKYVEKKK